MLLTTSCTAALEMSALLLDLQPGDTVIVPSFTFTSSALAFAREGAEILFCDIEPETLGPDPRSVAALLDDSVRAVVLVHYAGIALRRRGDPRGARGTGRTWRSSRTTPTACSAAGAGEPLGSLGRFATLSFHETKNFVCGEGGALILNDPADVDRAWVVYDKGTDRRAFFRGQVDKYSWRDTGSSFGLSDTLAAYLLGQLEQRETHPGEAAERLRALPRGALAPRAGAARHPGPGRPGRLRARLPPVLPAAARPRDAGPGSWTGCAPRASRRRSTTCRSTARRPASGSRRVQTDCPVSADVSDRLLRLPFHNGLSAEDTDRVVDALVRALTEEG